LPWGSSYYLLAVLRALIAADTGWPLSIWSAACRSGSWPAVLRPRSSDNRGEGWLARCWR
jgi:hypothetical protein